LLSQVDGFDSKQCSAGNKSLSYLHASSQKPDLNDAILFRSEQEVA
jgi:hypothetical protein